MNSNEKLTALKSSIKDLYNKHKESLLFHGLHHITFVSKKAKFFAENIGADTFIVESAGLVHDLNYVVETNSKPEAGKIFRAEILSAAGYLENEIAWIEQIIMESHTTTRGVEMSKEGMALSDGDTLFKAIPITPILFTSKYLEESEAVSESCLGKWSQNKRLSLNREYTFIPI